MKFRIKRLVINNFKIFKRIDIGISAENLTLLDGPNGFGKTSFYDALELLFTGGISRYKSLEELTVDKRIQSRGCSLLNDGAKDGESLSVRAELETSYGPLFIERSATKSVLDKSKGFSEFSFVLYKLKDIEDKDNLNPINDENEFLTQYLGGNYKKNFELFHYIEQENNIDILRSKGNKKQEKIDHLFDVGDYREKIENIERTKKIIQPLKLPKQKTQWERLEKELSLLKKSLLPSAEPVEYKRLILVTDQLWDKENVEFKAGTIAGWISEDGLLSRIRLFRENAIGYFTARNNAHIKKQLSPKKEAIESLLKYGHRLEYIETYKIDIKRFKIIGQYLTAAKGKLIDSINSKVLYFDKVFADLLPEYFNIDAYEKSINDLKILVSSSGKLQVSLAKLRDSRNAYVKNFKLYQEESKPSSICPTCGHDWESVGELVSQLENQAELLENVIRASATTLDVSIKQFQENYLNPIVTVFDDFVKNEQKLNPYKLQICDLTENQINYLSVLKGNFSKFSIDLVEFFTETFDIHEPVKASELDAKVSTLYKTVDFTNISNDFDDIFLQIFNESKDAVDNLQLDDLELKKSYLQWLYTKTITKEIESKEKEYIKQKSIYEKAIKLDKKLKRLLDMYKDNLNEYVSSIAKDIEILFHIYSGRLLQNCPNGLGVFIESDGKSISFRENPAKDHDVIFSMSSGQLSALVIAFTLALNNRYAKNDMLLIDDPVQTLDEINVAGFVDLLRTEFSDRQILLSTHEDNMSGYIRYKFEKMNLETQRINFRDIKYW